jgi:hypothetical protein
VALSIDPENLTCSGCILPVRAVARQNLNLFKPKAFLAAAGRTVRRNSRRKLGFMNV